jgi:stage V sporulation protein B
VSQFIKGAIWLFIAGFFVKLLGLLQRIITARLLGEESMGIYMMVFPTFVLLITIVQLGLPVAIAKSIALANATKDRMFEKRIVTTSWIIAMLMIFVITPTYIFFVPTIATMFFHDPHLLPLFYAMAPVIPIVAISAVIVYRIFMSSSGKATIPGGFQFEWK